MTPCFHLLAFNLGICRFIYSQLLSLVLYDSDDLPTVLNKTTKPKPDSLILSTRTKIQRLFHEKTCINRNVCFLSAKSKTQKFRLKTLL